VDAASAQLGGEGRILLRPSGTEPLVRVMVEAESTELANSIAQQIAGVVRQASPAAA
jgi:phosphoglucosamine mutase